MSTGKDNFTLEKEENGNERFPVIAPKGISLYHESPGGETEIAFDSLILPQDSAESGLSNPSSAYLLEQNLAKYRNNVHVTSSLGYPIQKSSFKVTNSAIVFKDYITSANELFEISMTGIVSGGQTVAETRSYKLAGEMADTLDEFDMFLEVDVLDFPFLVFRDGEQVFQSDDNDDSGATGNFYIVDNNFDGKGSVIKFFDPAVGTEAIMVASIGGVIDSQSVSTFAEVDLLSGQIDVLIPTVAALAGVPETNFRAAASRPNILAFSQRVTKMENAINSLLDKLDADSGVNDTDYRATLGL